jgi:hypothetical protein
MRKYSLIEISFGVVILLVLTSLTNVVGYQSVKLSAVNESPLFSMRIQKATQQEQNIVVSNYLGKGIGNLLQFPSRDNRTVLLNRVIVSIRKMDDETFRRFTELCIQKIIQDNTLSDIDPYEIKEALLVLRTQPDKINLHQLLGNNFNTKSPTIWERSVCNWIPGCATINILGIIFLIIWVICASIILILNSIFPSIAPGCTVMCTVNYGGIQNKCI